MPKKSGRVAVDWLPHKVHFKVHRSLRGLDQLIAGKDEADAPLCGSTIRVTEPGSEGTQPRDLANPLGMSSMPARMTTERGDVTCKRCRAMMARMKTDKPQGQAPAVTTRHGATMKILLSAWAAKHYSPPPAIRTLRGWVRTGQIHPPAELVGRHYMVEEDAVRIPTEPEEKDYPPVDERMLSPRVREILASVTKPSARTKRTLR